VHKRHAKVTQQEMLSIGQNVLITGGAGFIGSHLMDAIKPLAAEIYILDNLSNGKLKNIRYYIENEELKFIRTSLHNEDEIIKALEKCEIVFHLAANPEIRTASVYPDIHYRQNIATTFNLLEAIRKVGHVKTLVFTSSSTVYGEAKKIPTPEDYAPLEPISIYGASKLASENMITAYAHTYGFNAIIHRLANIIGPRSQHGIIYDFIKKLRDNPEELEILGDGNQTKSYLYITDCIEAILLSCQKAIRRVEVFNVGSEDQINVTTIAQIVVKEMGLKEVKFKPTGGVDGGRGWRGDVKNMLLDVTKLKSLGWKPKLNSEKAVRQTIRDLRKEHRSE